MNDKEELAIGMSLSIEIGKGANLVFQTHVPQIAEAGYINAVLDKLRDAANRQEAKYALLEQEFHLAQEQRLLEIAKSDFARIEGDYEEKRNQFYASGRKGEWKLPEREDTHRKGMLDRIKQLGFTIETVKQRIDELKQKAA